MKTHFAIATTLILATFASAAKPPISCGSGHGICPKQAIERAAAAAPYGAPGRYTMVVRSVGRAKGRIYLNSRRNYHDHRNISVVLFPQVQRQLRARFGGSIANTLKGQSIAVIGSARRVRIVSRGDQHDHAGKYYYQTHIAVTRGNQLVESPSGK